MSIINNKILTQQNINNPFILVIGSSGSGKTNYINKMLNIPFNKAYVPSKFITFNAIPDNNLIQIAELGGQHRYSSQQIYQIPSLIVIVVDITSNLSIKDVYNYYLPNYIHLNINFLIILNKIDINESSWRKNEILLLNQKVIEYRETFNKNIEIKLNSSK